MKKVKRNAKEFRFQQFVIQQDRCAMKVGTDGILLAAWTPVKDTMSFLDIGTGTGLIGLMLAQRISEGRGVLVEVDEAAANQANDNVKRSVFAERLKVVNEKIQTYAEQVTESFDLLVSNPPFFTGGVISEQEDRANVRHTLRLSHGNLLRSVQQLLNPTGSFCVVLPWLEGLRFVELAEMYQLFKHQMVAVKSNPDKPPHRVLLQFKKLPPADENVSTEELCIYEAAGQTPAYSAAYRELTKAFYL